MPTVIFFFFKKGFFCDENYLELTSTTLGKTESSLYIFSPWLYPYLSLHTLFISYISANYVYYKNKEQQQKGEIFGTVTF